MKNREILNRQKEVIFKLRIKLLVLFVLLSSLTFFLINYLEKEIKKSYLQQTTHNYERAYQTIYTQYKELGDVIFTGLLKLGDIKNKFQNIQQASIEEQAKIRKELYKKTIERYKTLQLKHIKSVNFILPDNSMFLKVKSPSKFGQQLSDKRHIIKYIHEHKKPMHSYEIGKYGAGFRFAYPILDKGKYLGVISITFGAEGITSSIMKQYNVLSNFFINQKNFNKDILEKKPHLFKMSHHQGFLFDMKVLKELKNTTKSDMKQLRPNKKTIKRLYDNISTNKVSNSLYDKKLQMVFTHIPIYHTLTKEKEAVLAIRSKIDTISILHQNNLIILLLSITIIGMVLYLIYQHNIKLMKEKISLQENIEKDKQLLEQAKMAQMGEMIGNIAHQWRQPLSTISTAASGMKVNHEYNILKEDDIPKHMDIILKNVDYLSQTIDTFRDFIKEDISVKEVVLQDKIDKTLDLSSSTLNQHHIELINNVDYSEPINVTVVTGVLTQVMINIINNAKDIIIEREIDSGWIKLEVIKQEKSALLTIEDNGGGIPDEILPKIFDPYFTTKHQSVGTGLGLFMSYKIITDHLKGKLYAKNTENGAKFFIEIPYSREQE